MKKNFLAISLLILLMLAISVGCSRGISTQYRKALTSTAKIECLSQSIDFDIKIDTSELNLSPEEQQMFSIYNHISGSFISKHDIKNNMGQLEGIIDINGVKMEVKLFTMKDKLIVHLPMFGKYLVLDLKSLQDENITDTSQLQTKISDAILKVWSETSAKQNIKDRGNKVININDTEVETREFEFTLSDDSVKKLISDMIDVILKDKEMQRLTINLMKQKHNPSEPTEAEIEKEISNTLKDFETFLRSMIVENLKYTGNLDNNSYLAQETASFSLRSNVPEAGDLIVNSAYTIRRWDIGKALTIEMPDLTPDNSMTLKDLSGNQERLMGDFPQ